MITLPYHTSYKALPDSSFPSSYSPLSLPLDNSTKELSTPTGSNSSLIPSYGSSLSVNCSIKVSGHGHVIQLWAITMDAQEHVTI